MPDTHPRTTGSSTAGGPHDAALPGRATGMPGLERLAAVSLRLLIVAALVAVLTFAIVKFRLVVLPLVIGAMIATVLAPAARWLRRRGLPHNLAVTLVFALWLALLLGILAGIVPAVILEFDDFKERVAEGLASLRTWLIEGPLHVDPQTIDRYPSQILSEASGSPGAWFGAVLSRAAIALEIVTGVVLTIPIVFFLLKDGERIRDWCLGWVTGPAHGKARRISTHAWARLGTFVRGLVFVALFDAAFIAIGLLAIGVPLVLPLAVITFVGAFIPLLGATVAGLLAVLVAFVAGGWVDGLLALGVVIAVQQIEQFILSPLVMSRAVQVHPLVILLAMTAGGVIAGVVGTFLAVPLAALAAILLQELRPKLI